MPKTIDFPYLFSIPSLGPVLGALTKWGVLAPKWGTNTTLNCIIGWIWVKVV